MFFFIIGSDTGTCGVFRFLFPFFQKGMSANVEKSSCPSGSSYGEVSEYARGMALGRNEKDPPVKRAATLPAGFETAIKT